MSTCLGKNCLFGLPRVPLINCCQFMYFRFVGSDCVCSRSLLMFSLRTLDRHDTVSIWMIDV